jgi:hypothetical protein
MTEIVFSRKHVVCSLFLVKILKPSKVRDKEVKTNTEMEAAD